MLTVEEKHQLATTLSQASQKCSDDPVLYCALMIAWYAVGRGWSNTDSRVAHEVVRLTGVLIENLLHTDVAPGAQAKLQRAKVGLAPVRKKQKT
jgi:hypothetical protein